MELSFYIWAGNVGDEIGLEMTSWRVYALSVLLIRTTCDIPFPQRACLNVSFF